MFARQWMTRDPLTTGPATPLADACEQLALRHLRRLPVVDRGRVRGLLTLEPARAALATGATLVADAMDDGPHLARSDAPIEDLALELRRLRRDEALIVDDGHLVGILTSSDLFRGLAQVLGAGQPGARVVVEVPPDDLRALPRLVALACTQGLELLSLAACALSPGEGRTVALRVRGPDLKPFLERLWARRGWRVLQVHRPTTAADADAA